MELIFLASSFFSTAIPLLILGVSALYHHIGVTIRSLAEMKSIPHTLICDLSPSSQGVATESCGIFSEETAILLIMLLIASFAGIVVCAFNDTYIRHIHLLLTLATTFLSRSILYCSLVDWMFAALLSSSASIWPPGGEWYGAIGHHVVFAVLLHTLSGHVRFTGTAQGIVNPGFECGVFLPSVVILAMVWRYSIQPWWPFGSTSLSAFTVLCGCAEVLAGRWALYSLGPEQAPRPCAHCGQCARCNSCTHCVVEHAIQNTASPTRLLPLCLSSATSTKECIRYIPHWSRTAASAAVTSYTRYYPLVVFGWLSFFMALTCWQLRLSKVG